MLLDVTNIPPFRPETFRGLSLRVRDFTLGHRIDLAGDSAAAGSGAGNFIAALLAVVIFVPLIGLSGWALARFSGSWGFGLAFLAVFLGIPGAVVLRMSSLPRHLSVVVDFDRGTLATLLPPPTKLAHLLGRKPERIVEAPLASVRDLALSVRQVRGRANPTPTRGYSIAELSMRAPVDGTLQPLHPVTSALFPIDQDEDARDALLPLAWEMARASGAPLKILYHRLWHLRPAVVELDPRAVVPAQGAGG